MQERFDRTSNWSGIDHFDRKMRCNCDRASLDKTVLTILLSMLGYFIVLILTRNEFTKNMSEMLLGKCRHKK